MMDDVDMCAWKMQAECVSYVWLLRRDTELTRKDRETIARLLEELWRCHTPEATRRLKRDMATESADTLFTPRT